MRRVCLTVMLLVASPAAAATWADALFASPAHDFGTVARGPILTHSYRLTNTTGQPLHISAIRVSCGCTTALARSADIAPGQTSEIIAQMDTRRFVGPKTVTIYVQFDRPQWEEVQLSISANGRDDMSLAPESLAFGTVPQGATPSRTAVVTFAGSSTFLVSVQADSNYVQLAAKNIRNTGAELAYEVTATLRPDTPAGKWFTDIWLTTNNASMPRVRLPLSVDVTMPLHLSSSILAFGTVPPGEKAEKRIIVKAPQPFRISQIGGTDDAVSASFDTEAKPVHIIVVAIKPGSPGDFTRTLKIATDLSADNAVDLPITATVAMPHIE